MKQTPVHHNSNPDLLALIPLGAKRLVEVGCSSGALARDYKLRNSNCWYLGCDIDASYIDLAQQYCDEVIVLDIDQAGDDFYERYRGCDVWVFGDTLEHMKDPWKVLGKVRESMVGGGMVVACIPNAQHWSIQARLATGAFWYEDAGLLDRTHLRWFTRVTIQNLFEQAGFTVVQMSARVFSEPGYDALVPVIEEMAELCGADPKVAAEDARAFQYLVVAVAA